MDEHNCEHVSSRGILKSCTFHSPNPRSSCNSDIQYLVDMLQSNRMSNGMSIYVCSDLLRLFVTKVVPRIRHSFVLVSGDSDITVPYEAMTEQDTNRLLNNPLLIHWYAQNLICHHFQKVLPMPIGLDFHTIASNPNFAWRQSNEPSSPVEQERILKGIRAKSQPFDQRNMKILVNFTMNNDRFGQRKSALTVIPNELLCVSQEFMPRTVLWNKMTEHAFVLSPFGMGMDCHRTWEALCLGCIPIVQTNALSELFDGLPVLVVDDWSQITPQLLTDTIDKFASFAYDKLKLEYWTNTVNARILESAVTKSTVSISGNKNIV